MKKSMLPAVVGILLLVQGHTATTPPVSSPAPLSSFSSPMIAYTWFKDEELTEPVGLVSEINTELTRLRNQYPSYIFSGTPGAGLFQFEYGYHPVFSDVVIYSNY